MVDSSAPKRSDGGRDSEVKNKTPRAKSLPLAPPRVDGLPELVPARMVNEVLYCERLMYLEWVQAEWADNRYTKDGNAVHRRVDKKDEFLKVSSTANAKEQKEETDAAADTDEERPYTARSVWLSSEDLGVTAKVDVVEVSGNQVAPVEYKRGKCPEMGPYLPERAQVAVQALLLRDHGYEVAKGEIYFAKDRRRVDVVLDESLVDTTRSAISRAREILLEGCCPPPLTDSPKCVGCSLSGICLPDELQVLHERVEEELPNHSLELGDDPWDLGGPEPDPKYNTPVRRLFPGRDERIPLYVQGRGAQVRLSGDRLVVNVPGEKAVQVRLMNTSSVTLYGNVQVTAQAMRKMLDESIPLLFASSGGWLVGRAVGSEPKNVELKAAQYAISSDPAACLALAQQIVVAKLLNSRTLLRRNHKGHSAVALGELAQLAKKAKVAPSLDSLLGLEGAGARAYFKKFSGMLKIEQSETFDFTRRNRRPPKDPINALLSFSYSLLTRECVVAVHSVGLDPLVGFYHQPRFGRMSLALDLMEEFRPILADSVVVSVINNGIVQKQDFVHGNGAVALKAPARKRVIQAMERRLDQLVTHTIFDYRLSYRRVLELQARLLSRVILGEIESYPAFRIR